MGEGDTPGSLTNGVQTATAVATLPPGHEVIPGETVFLNADSDTLIILTDLE